MGVVWYITLLAHYTFHMSTLLSYIDIVFIQFYKVSIYTFTRHWCNVVCIIRRQVCPRVVQVNSMQDIFTWTYNHIDVRSH